MAKILLINGPNLNMLGIREPEKYGRLRLSSIENDVKSIIEAKGYSYTAFQSNSESEIVSFIQREGLESKGILLNAGALTHSSISLRDALLAVNCPFVEIHLTNVFKREQFRQLSYLSDIAIGVITGFGPDSYFLAANGLLNYIENNSK